MDRSEANRPTQRRLSKRAARRDRRSTTRAYANYYNIIIYLVLLTVRCVPQVVNLFDKMAIRYIRSVRWRARCDVGRHRVDHDGVTVPRAFQSCLPCLIR